jgi:predicted O-linked N-acetylglucosamine transferase (SPINDLY family)
LVSFFQEHTVGVLSEGVLAHLPRPKFRVLVFLIDPPPEDDAIAR